MKLSKILKLFALSLIIGGLLVAIASIVAPHSVAAAKCGDVKTSIDFGCDGSTNSKSGGSANPIFQILIIVIRFLSVGVGLAVAGGIIWGGILFVTARGNSSQTQKGVTVIVNSVIGLLLFIFMFAILNFVIPGGIFSS